MLKYISIESGFRRLLPGWGAARPHRQEHVITLASTGPGRSGGPISLAGLGQEYCSWSPGVSHSLAPDSEWAGGRHWADGARPATRTWWAAGTGETELRAGSGVPLTGNTIKMNKYQEWNTVKIQLFELENHLNTLRYAEFAAENCSSHIMCVPESGLNTCWNTWNSSWLKYWSN